MPVATAVTGVALAAIGTGVAVYSAVQQGKAAEAEAKFQEDVANNAAITAQQEAAFEARQISRRNKLVLGKQRAAAAKSGVLISGSVTDVIEDSTVQGELDRLAALYSGEARSTAFKSQAELSRFAAANISTNTLLTSIGTGLQGASQVASAGSRIPSFQNI